MTPNDAADMWAWWVRAWADAWAACEQTRGVTDSARARHALAWETTCRELATAARRLLDVAEAREADRRAGWARLLGGNA